MALFLCPSAAVAQAQAALAAAVDKDFPALVLGFMGGFVQNNDTRHSEVQMANRIRASYGKNVNVVLFENRQTVKAREQVISWLAENGYREPYPEGRERPRIILFGHSWGASTVVFFARDLQRDHIPVLLTIQVDSVTKDGRDDSLIPANVKEAVNFYQTRGFLRGRPAIRAQDPSRTTILGNFAFRYQEQPAECRNYPWSARVLFKWHTAIECDPKVWNQIEGLIRARLPLVQAP